MRPVRLAVVLLLVAPATAAAQNGEERPTYPVAEQPAPCGATTCVHWVATGEDAPPPDDADHDGTADYVQAVDAAFEHAIGVETAGDLGWPEPVADAGRGGDDRLDVYVKALAGYAGATGISQPAFGRSAAAYVLVDDDLAQYAAAQRGALLRSVAAHEANHALQFAADDAS